MLTLLIPSVYTHPLAGSSTLPSELGNWQAFNGGNWAGDFYDGWWVMLSLHSNKISGALPTQIGRMNIRNGLTLGDNSLSKSLPTELGQLVRYGTIRLL